MGTIEQNYWITGREGKLISVVVHYPKNLSENTQYGIVIYCHGFTGDKTGSNRMGVKLARTLSEQNYVTVRFDYLGSGESEGEFDTETSFSGWLTDLKTVISWVETLDYSDNERVSLVGHSLGGSLVTYLSSSLANLKCVCALAPVSRLEKNFKEIIIGPTLWNKSLKGEVIKDFYGKKFSLQPTFVDDLIQYDILSEAQNISIPILIIHGKKDQAVPYEDSCKLTEVICANNKKLRIFDEEEHLLSEQIFPPITQWLKSYL